LDSLVVSNIRQRPLRSAISVLGVALGVALVMLFTGLAHGMSDDLQKRSSNVSAEIIFTRPGSLNIGSSSANVSTKYVELLQKIDAAAADAGRTPELLIQVDLAGEATKFGTPPEEVPRLFDAAAACTAARVTGLMTLPPVPDSPEDARPWFRKLRDLRDQWLAAGIPEPMLQELSMGMSADFEVAIQEGSTIVRVGTAIFGSRYVQA
jgi:hypothetical protein